MSRQWTAPGRRGDGLALLAGLLLPLAFAPINFAPLALLSLVLLFYLISPLERPADGLRRGLLFGFGYFVVGISWVYVVIHQFSNTPMIAALLMTLLFVLACALYPALFGYLVVLLRNTLPVSQGASLLLLMPMVWLLVEWLRATLFTGFPWLSIGYSQIDTPLAGFAPIVGVYGVGLIVAISAGVVLLATLRRAPLLVLWLLIPLLVGEGLKRVDWSEPHGTPLRVALVQGNLPQMTKWDREMIDQRMALYRDQTLPLLGSYDLVVWPENALTVFYQDYQQDYFDPLESLAKESGTDLLLGVPLLAEDQVHYFTSMMNIGPSGHQFYKKNHLVPFGEFLPFASLLSGLLPLFDLPMSSFSSGGEGQQPIAIGEQLASVTICYEDLFAEEVFRNMPQATLLINGSNDAWFGRSFAPYQHLQVARMRALEAGRPLIRATTSGVSALIDAKGAIIDQSPLNEPSLLTGDIIPQRGITPYLRWGEWPLLVLFMLAALALRLRRRDPG